MTDPSTDTPDPPESRIAEIAPRQVRAMLGRAARKRGRTYADVSREWAEDRELNDPELHDLWLIWGDTAERAPATPEGGETSPLENPTTEFKVEPETLKSAGGELDDLLARADRLATGKMHHTQKLIGDLTAALRRQRDETNLIRRQVERRDFTIKDLAETVGRLERELAEARATQIERQDVELILTKCFGGTSGYRNIGIATDKVITLVRATREKETP